jgi:hypothetical protein
VDINQKQTKRFAQLRTSSHKLNVETGRYGLARIINPLKICYQYCDEDTVLHPAEFPFFEPIYGDE